MKKALNIPPLEDRSDFAANQNKRSPSDLLVLLHPHDLISAIDVEHLAGNGRGAVAG